jgi:hypothetical protein
LLNFAWEEGLTILQLKFFKQAQKSKCPRKCNTSVVGVRCKNKEVKHRSEK